MNRHDYLTKTPVPKFIMSLAVPTIISMLVTGIYNTADTFFVGKISTQATAAVGLVFSIMAIIQAVGFFFGQGSGTFMSRTLGSGDKRSASEMASLSFTLAVSLGTLILIMVFKMGVSGAAIATVAGQITSFFILLIGSRKGENIKLNAKIYISV